MEVWSRASGVLVELSSELLLKVMSAKPRHYRKEGGSGCDQKRKNIQQKKSANKSVMH